MSTEARPVEQEHHIHNLESGEIKLHAMKTLHAGSLS